MKKKLSPKFHAIDHAFFIPETLLTRNLRRGKQDFSHHSVGTQKETYPYQGAVRGIENLPKVGDVQTYFFFDFCRRAIASSTSAIPKRSAE